MTQQREHDLGAMFYRLVNAIMEAERPILAGHGITMWEYTVLASLAQQPAARQNDLAERTGRDQTRLIGELDRLQELGLLVRTPDPADRRARVVTITAKGEKVLARCRQRIRVMEDELLADVPARDRATFLRVLQTLAERA